MQKYDEKLKKVTYECDNQEYIILNKCPYCNLDIHPNTDASYSLKNNNHIVNVLSLKCPSCKNDYFIFNDFSDGTLSNEKYIASFPRYGFSGNSSLLKSTSEKFQLLYSQSINSELLGHYDIAYLGFVKSLEILLKDIAIQEHPESEDNILFCNLMTCIEQYHSKNSHLFSTKLLEILKNDYLGYQRSFNFQDFSEIIKDFIDYFLHYLELFVKMHPPK